MAERCAYKVKCCTRALNVILVFTNEGKRFLRVGLAVPLFGSISTLRAMVAEEGKISPDQVILTEMNSNGFQRSFSDEDDITSISESDVIYAFQAPPLFTRGGSMRFSGYTIMGKTADLTVVQKTIIDTLHKEGKLQTFIAKEAGCSQSAVSKHVNRKLSGRKKCGRKRCTTNRENRSLERLPLLNHRQGQRRLTWAKEKKKC
ncbi:Ubiquitin carboxyl-terminal hydrolase 43 [Labeo rohita]|uniref:Ubiquitin carboxyl-terminal hydrolase 43 n=1 Tax=Labeo rohita TaxID=84645 RepID=A0ABQ8MKY1_LABRO|nr:Ubiquitin carboxyl-terminal hydrolase 43 [Labeo rohita]